MPIPMFNYPLFGVYSNVQPFTVRDGATYLMTLEGLRDWIRDELVPHLDGEITKLTESWEENVTNIVTQFEAISAALILTANELAGQSGASAAAAQAAQAAAESARDLAQQYASEAVEAQDGAIAALLDNPATQTRVKLDALYVGIATYNALAEVINTGRLSETSLDVLFDAKVDSEYLTVALAERDAKISALEASDEATEEILSTGRLGEIALDARYEKVKPTPIAVFIGSSNVAPGTWPEQLGARMGWTVKNFSLGGGGYTSDLVNKFITQINGAIADTSYNHDDVKFVFLADAGNDIRALRSVSAEAPAVIQAAKNAYPNARVIILPALWGYATDNIIAARMLNVLPVAEELREFARTYGAEFIDFTWLWNWDDSAMMMPNEVHYTPTGYTRIARYVESYMRGNSPRVDRGWRPIASKSTIVAGGFTSWRAKREGNNVRIQGTYLPNGPLGLGTDIGDMPFGMRPFENAYVLSVANNSASQTVAIYSNGTVRAFSGAGNMVHYLDAEIPIF